MQATVVTIDVDWAPDVAIDHVAQLLVERRVRATWFVTHRSDAIDRLREHDDLFELGIHPNFLPGSTHGATHADVLEHCLALVPDALSMRTHSLYQSTPLLALVLETTPIQVDSSVLLTGARAIEPTTFTWNGRSLVRVPIFWEDDLAMEADAEWSLDVSALEAPGLRVYDFHPVHVYLNSSEMAPYRALRSSQRLQECSERTLEPYVNRGRGTGSLFVELLDAVTAGGETALIGDFRAQTVER